MAVSALVLEHCGDEDEAIAALLHDAAEDGDNGTEQLRQIEARFGPQVRHIVEMCSDTTEHPKPPWLERKRRYIQHLNEIVSGGPSETAYLRVSLADKLHNARVTIADIERDGDDRVFDRFNSGEDHDERRRNTLGYYADLSRAYC